MHSRGAVVTKALRIGIVAVTLVATQALLAGPSSAVESMIKESTLPNGNPGLIDVSVSSIVFSEGAIAVTSTVDCTGATIYVVDFSGSQGREGHQINGYSYLSNVACGQAFTHTITATEPEVFGAGPAIVEVTASACGTSSGACTAETLRMRVVLLPN
jgi:hypothetical protein